MLKAHLTCRPGGKVFNSSDENYKIICDGAQPAPCGIELFMHLFKSKGGQISTLPIAHFVPLGLIWTIWNYLEASEQFEQFEQF